MLDQNIFIVEVFSSISFLIYGYLSFKSERMINEFKRWNISQFRTIVGVSQLLGGSGLILGFYLPIMTIISSLGLTVLMLLGFFLRILVKDGLLRSLPSLFYFFINGYIFLFSYKNLI
tara:strand:+ start:1539 stop:1892 length:354 start_codon:yes stop_codon:yes gene_type:complete